MKVKYCSLVWGLVFIATMFGLNPVSCQNVLPTDTYIIQFEGKEVDPHRVKTEGIHFNSVDFYFAAVWREGADLNKIKESAPLFLNFSNTYDENGWPVFVTRHFGRDLIFKLEDAKPVIVYRSAQPGQISIIIAQPPYILDQINLDKTTEGLTVPYDDNSYYPRGPFVIKVLHGKDEVTTRPFQVTSRKDGSYDIKLVQSAFLPEPAPCEEVISAVDQYLKSVDLTLEYEGYAEDYRNLVGKYPEYCGYIKHQILTATAIKGLRVFIDDYMYPIEVTKFKIEE